MFYEATAASWPPVRGPQVIFLREAGPNWAGGACTTRIWSLAGKSACTRSRTNKSSGGQRKSPPAHPTPLPSELRVAAARAPVHAVAFFAALTVACTLTRTITAHITTHNNTRNLTGLDAHCAAARAASSPDAGWRARRPCLWLYWLQLVLRLYQS